MSKEAEFFTSTREEFVDEFVHPDDQRPWRKPASDERCRSGPSS
jgi:hypothetical protein